MDALGEISQHARPLEIPGPRLVGIPRVCLQTSYPWRKAQREPAEAAAPEQAALDGDRR